MRKMKGAFLSLAIVSFLLIFFGCTDGGPTLLTVAAAVEKADGGGTSALIVITEAGGFNFVDDANVTINGTTITPLGFLGMYIGAGPAINVGGDVLLEVERGGSMVTAILQMPEKPTVNTPADGSGSADILLSWGWGGATDPDGFTIAVDSAYTIDPDGYSGNALGSDNDHTIPLGTFDTTLTEAYVDVSAIMQTNALAGDAEASTFMVGHTDTSEAFDP
jgi:hypothetical protein